MSNTKEDDLRARIVAAALSWVGTPYRHQGRRKGVGCDCLGLVLGVWRDVYGSPAPAPLPYASDWSLQTGRDALLDAARRHCRETPVDAALAGDLILFRWRRDVAASHAAILIDGDGGFVHACEGNSVVVTRMVPQWRRRLAGAFAFPSTFSG
ncbi:MAG: C40 family peptidase [Rhizobiaceae bacterium]|nr:C40 family peptidase [Rhizobiaceae bacterium]